MTKALRTGNIKTILFILRTIDTEGSKRVSTGGATYILKPKILVLTQVTPAFQPRIAELSHIISNNFTELLYNAIIFKD